MKPIRAFPCIFLALLAIFTLASCRTPVDPKSTPEATSTPGATTTPVATLDPGATTAPDVAAPAEVNALSASVTRDSAALSWYDPSDADFTTVLISWNSGSLEVPKGTQSATLTGLSGGSEYLITVRTRDGTGNISTGSTLSIGTLTSAAFVISIADVNVSLSLAGSSVFSKTDTLSLSLSGNWESYEWRLDGTPIPGAASATLTLPLAGLSYGNHMITVMLMSNGALYSKDISFKVGA